MLGEDYTKSFNRLFISLNSPHNPVGRCYYYPPFIGDELKLGSLRRFQGQEFEPSSIELQNQSSQPLSSPLFVHGDKRLSCYYSQEGFPLLTSGSVVQNPSAVQETQVQSLGQEYLLEEGMADHSIILVWKILWTEEPGGLQSIGPRRVRHN